MTGAAREAWEEARAELEEVKLFCVISIPHISQVYMMYRGLLVDGRSEAGPESQLTGLYTREQVPWDELAFPVIIETLNLWYEDKARGEERVHYGDLIKHEDASYSFRTW